MTKLVLALMVAVPSLALAQVEEPSPLATSPETTPTTAPATGGAAARGSKNLSGRFGIGGQAENLGGVGGGLSLKYWISDLGIQALLGFDRTPDPDDMGPLESQQALGIGLRVLYNFARSNDTNMYGGGGLSLGLIDADAVDIDLVLGVEHFFTDYFSVGGHVGATFGLSGGSEGLVGIGNAASWGTSFHFYF